MHVRLISIAVAALLLSAVNGCQPKPSPSPSPTTPVISPAPPQADVTRVYDVRELFIPIPDFYGEPTFSRQLPEAGDLATLEKENANANANLFGGGSAVKDAPQPTRRELLDGLITCIETTITPRVWETRPKMREENGRLTVTAPPDTQRQLAALIAEARQRMNLQVTLEFRILDPADLPMDDIDPRLSNKLRMALSPVRPRNGTELTDKEVKLLIRKIESDTRSTFVTAPRITLFNGQRAYVMVATQKAYTSGYTPKSNGHGFDPQVSIAESGFIFGASASVSDDRTHVAVDLLMRDSKLLGMSHSIFAGALPDEKLMIDVPNMRVRELRAIAAIPNGHTVMFRGLRDITQEVGWNAPATQPSAAGGNATPGGELIILVKPTVIVEQ